MNNSYYITSEKNSVFINQRLEAFHKSNHSIELVKKTIIKKNDNVVFFTLDNKSLKKLKKINNLKQVKIFFVYDVYHIGQVLGSTQFTNNIKFRIIKFFKELKVKIKIWLINYDQVNFFKYKVNFKYLLVSSSKKNIPKKILSIPSNFLIHVKPHVDHKLKILIKKFNKNKINKTNNFIFFFDSHFPLHPDSLQKEIINNKKVIIFNLINIYLKYLKRNLINKNLTKKIIIFLHPRTFDIIQKNKLIKNYISKLLPRNIILSNGIFSFISNNNFSIKKNKLIVQYGSQLSLLKNEILLNDLKNVDVLELDKKFKEDFSLLKKKHDDIKNYLKNYEIIEIKQFNNVNKKNFIRFS